MNKLPFGAWLTHQHHIEGDTATIKGIRLLSRFVIGHNSFPKTAKNYTSYHRWLLKNVRGTTTAHLYMLALEAAWSKWELLLPEDIPQTTNQPVTKE
jgi:hypothetical protein